MSSLKNSVVGIFLKEKPYILYNHCVVHRIALGTKILAERF